MKVNWAPTADRLLQQRDRFTQRAIRQEFEQVIGGMASPPAPQSIEFDTDKGGYLTFVAEERYSVVWYLTNDTASVLAVVPTTRFSPGTHDLKARVNDVVQTESHGAVNVR